MLLTVDDAANSSDVLTTTNHDDVPKLELDMVNDFACGQVKADSVVDLHIWIWVAQRSAIVSYGIWCTFWTPGDALDPTQLVGGLLLMNLVQCKLALRVIE